MRDNEEEEPSPETLPSKLNPNQNIQNPPENEFQIQNDENEVFKNYEINQNPINQNQNQIKQRNSESKMESSRIKTNQNLNISKYSKANSSVPYNKFENHNIQNLAYALVKDYNQLHIDKENDFMERMKFDIYKRQIRDDRINKLIEQNKMKIDEEERIKAFNRLIEDANRRIEAQENLESMKNKLEDDLINPNTKKYNQNEWKEIYHNRFKKYNERVNDKIEKMKKEKSEIVKQKEEEELKLCPTKKASKKHIEEASKRMYDEAIKRKLKMEEKKSRINNIENDASKYKKIIKSEAYSFLDDDDDNNNKQNYNYNYQRISRKKGQPVSEFNNQRFDIRNKINQKPKIVNDYNKPIYNNYNKNNNNKNIINNNNYNLNKNDFENNNYNNNKFNNEINYYNDIITSPKIENNGNKKNLDEYLEDETEIKEVPKPVGMAKELMLNEIGNNINKKKLEEAALKRLSQRTDNEDYENEEENNNIVTYNNKSSNEASKIVEQFFTNNLKK